MNIKTQINILTSLSENESGAKVHNFIWKDENELLKQIRWYGGQFFWHIKSRN
jgi:hypothetical protein